MSEKSVINPKHYEFTLRGHTFQVVDLMEERFPDDAHLSQALKYLMRAGRKADSSYLKDVGKCLWWCARAIMFKGGKYVELPPGTPTSEEIATSSGRGKALRVSTTGINAKGEQVR